MRERYGLEFKRSRTSDRKNYSASTLASWHASVSPRLQLATSLARSLGSVIMLLGERSRYGLISESSPRWVRSPTLLIVLCQCAIQCPSCKTICISDRPEIRCSNCHRQFRFEEGTSLLELCKRRQ